MARQAIGAGLALFARNPAKRFCELLRHSEVRQSLYDEFAASGLQSP